MGRKKKKSLKPWCWYCNREFDDEKVLIGHQKAKHFRCHICHKKLYTAPGLAIHCSQVHKETITKVPNAMPERLTMDLEIYGMEGVPEEAKHAREIEKYGRLTEETSSEAKRPKLEMQSTFPGMIPGFPPVIMPGMPPVMPGMVPPAGQIYGMMPHPMTMPNSSMATSQPGLLIPPQKPLFPSGTQLLTPHSQAKPGVPVPQVPPPTTISTPMPSVVSELLKNATLVAPLPDNSQLMHPKEDLSMEEIRAQRPQYSTSSKLPPPPMSSGPTPVSLPGPPILRPGMPPIPGPMPNNIIRPGMGPVFMGLRPMGQM